MSSFDKREKAFEDKFAHDAEISFRIRARTLKLLGKWAAIQLALSETEQQIYIKKVVDIDFDKEDIKPALAMIAQDLQQSKILIYQQELASKFEEFHNHAYHTIMNDE